MRLTKNEVEKVKKHREKYGKCLICGGDQQEVAPMFLDVLVQGSKFVENDYMLFSMIAIKCEICEHIEFFNRSVLKEKEDEANVA